MAAGLQGVACVALKGQLHDGVRLLLNNPDDAAFDVFRTDPEDLLHLEDEEISGLVNADDWNLVGVKFA